MRFFTMPILLIGVACTKPPVKSVMLGIPTGYIGEFTIIENQKNGRDFDGAALENFGDYVIEFNSIENNEAQVKDISPLMSRKEIVASYNDVTPIASGSRETVNVGDPIFTWDRDQENRKIICKVIKQ